MLFFKKNQVKNQIKTNSKNLKTQTIKSSNEDFLDNRLYEFSKKIKKLSKDEASASLLARQLSRLIKAEKF